MIVWSFSLGVDFLKKVLLCEAKHPIVISAITMIAAPFGLSHQVMILFGGNNLIVSLSYFHFHTR